MLRSALDLLIETDWNRAGKEVLSLIITPHRVNPPSQEELSGLVEAFKASPAVQGLYSDADRSNLLYLPRWRHVELCCDVSADLKRIFLPHDSSARLQEFLQQVSASQVFEHDVRVVVRSRHGGILSLPWELLLLREDEPSLFTGLKFQLVRCLVGFGVTETPLDSVLCGITGASRLGNVPNPNQSRCHFFGSPVTLSAITGHKRLSRPAAFVLAADRSSEGFCLDDNETPIRRPRFDSNCPCSVAAESLVSLLGNTSALCFCALVVCRCCQQALTLLQENPSMRASLGLKSNTTKTGSRHLLNWLLHALTREMAVDEVLLEYRKQAFYAQTNEWPGGWRDWWSPTLFSKSIEAAFAFKARGRMFDRIFHWRHPYAI